MGSFGENLKRERELRGVSLDDIAEATKIGTRLLRALEEEQFELLPGGIFNKGFVRAYAKYLGINEDEAVADYLQAAGESSPDPRIIADQNSSRIDRSAGNMGDSRMASFPIIPVLILLIVIAAGAGGWHIYQERQKERRAKQDAARTEEKALPSPSVNPTPAATSNPLGSGATESAIPEGRGTTATPLDAAGGVAPNQAAPGKTGLNSGATPTTPNSTPSPNLATGATQPVNAGPAAVSPANAGSPQTTTQSFEVVVRPRDKAWVSIKTDGKITVRGIIGPPDVKTIRANEQIVFWTGNAGAVDVSFNGQPVPIAGGPNEVAVLVITPKGAVAGKPAPASHTP